MKINYISAYFKPTIIESICKPWELGNKLKIMKHFYIMLKNRPILMKLKKFMEN